MENQKMFECKDICVTFLSHQKGSGHMYKSGDRVYCKTCNSSLKKDEIDYSKNKRCPCCKNILRWTPNNPRSRKNRIRLFKRID